MFDDPARFLQKLEKMTALVRGARELGGFSKYYQAK